MISNSTITPSIVAEIIAERLAVPEIRATYRMQFNHAFTFADATQFVPYLASLGISHLYASPVFQAAPGSLHGYDVIDYTQLSAEIGTRAELETLVQTLREHEMGLILDFVPNHMGIEKGANAWWQDVLENGRLSRYAEYFDIDWHPAKRELRNKVLLPFLGDQYGEILEQGELKLTYDAGTFTVQYWDTPFPIDPQSYPIILQRIQPVLADILEPDHIDMMEMESISIALERLPVASDDQPELDLVDFRHREQTVSMRRLSDLVDRSEPVHQALNQVLEELNGQVGDSVSFDALNVLLDQQAYRLSYWRVASEEINYRRFFAINTLAAIRQEDSAVFEATHVLLLDLLTAGLVDGVRFDHPDGLWDPERYLHDFQAAYVRAAVRDRIQPASEEEWQEILPDLNREIRDALAFIDEENGTWPVWTVVEKILEADESLPGSWKTSGTVGYEFMQAATGVLVSNQNRSLLDTIYARYTGEKIRYNELVYEMKLWQLREAFASELNVLTSVANRISESDRHSRDFTFNTLRAVLREILACFGVYRTYTACREGDVSEYDTATINAAVNEAMRRNPQFEPSIFEFIRSILLLHATGEIEERRFAPCHFAMKLQQLSGPVMAKGLEDTTFYRFNRLTSINEVGGDPASFGTSVSEFHRQNQARLRDWPQSQVNSTTHDTKRSEDVRAMISVLSERPTEWRAAINRWTRLNRRFKVKIDNALAPHRVDEWVLYQTLLGTWPAHGLADINSTYVKRIQAYMLKVVREAGRYSNWVNPNQQYEEAIHNFIGGMLNKRRARAFLTDIDAVATAQRDAALANALSQQVMKLTSPGVPDIYQGTEFWDDSLVDPDNRRPVNYKIRLTAIDRDALTTDLIDSRTDGEIKQHLTRLLLQFRRDQPSLFAVGDYQPVRISGPASQHAIAWLREMDDEKLLVVVPRLMYTLATGKDIFGNSELWTETLLHLPASLDHNGWRNLLENDAPVVDPTDLQGLFAQMPLAVLVWQGDEHA